MIPAHHGDHLNFMFLTSGWEYPVFSSGVPVPYFIRSHRKPNLIFLKNQAF